MASQDYIETVISSDLGNRAISLLLLYSYMIAYYLFITDLRRIYYTYSG